VPFNGRFEFVEQALKMHFHVVNATSLQQLRAVLKQQTVFCVLICGNILEMDHLRYCKRMCAESAKAPLLFFGATGDDGISFHLGRYGIDHFVARDHMDDLLQLLHQLQARATFRIDLSDFGIHLNECTGFWTRRFHDLILKDCNYLNYLRVDEIAAQLKIRPTTLYHGLNGDCRMSPKQLLLCLRNYYAAYLLSFCNARIHSVADECGFADEQTLCRSFKKATGIPPRTFSRHYRWDDFPALFVAQYNRKLAKSQ